MTSHVTPERGRPSLLDQLVRFVGFRAEPQPDPEPAAALGLGEVAVWSRSLTARWPAVAAAVGVAAGVVVVALGDWSIGLIVAFAGLVALAFTRIRVTADRTGLLVRFGWLPWPAIRIRIDKIDRAASIDVRPTEWGGWGYRLAGLARGFNRRAVVLRQGDGIHLVLRNGREFAVTIDDAAGGAAVINAYVARNQAPDSIETDGL